MSWLERLTGGFKKTADRLGDNLTGLTSKVALDAATLDLDMFGDALVYGLSIYVITSDSRKQASASMVKGLFMLFFGVVVLGEAVYKELNPIIPDASTIGIIGAIALMANLVCFFMLYTHREDSLNMSSTWLCSRNDLVANVGVLFAGLLTYILASRWPDIIVGVLIAGLFLRSAIHVIGQAKLAMQ